MRERFIVEGLAGRRSLKGDLPVRGAKNAALKALPACVLFEDTVVLENMPIIEDVLRMSELLRASGASVEIEGHTATIVPPEKWSTQLEASIAERVRASVVLTGPLLARAGEAHFPTPGGDVIGARPIDLFLEGFTAMGAEVEEKNGVFSVRAPKGLQGARIVMPFISVTVTETLMLAAVLAKGETILENAAMEPEIPALADFLNECGAQIVGAGTPGIRIQGTGGAPLRAAGRRMKMPPDRIEAGSFAILAALAGEEVRITGCVPKDIEVLLATLARAGVVFEEGKDFIRIKGGGLSGHRYKSVNVRTHEFPGFATDLQAPMAVFLTQAEGEATLLETIFDGRFRYAEELSRMGADITVMNPHQILVRGPRALESAELESPDIRAGLAYLMAAAVASGTSVIDNAYVIDRGYERIEERLAGIGLGIRREIAR